ncbi:hypothetical protein ACTWPT_47080 [Nonomuraea sp. 3N208]|uniref:hypothetical protein n=1 Tax=Nonomuraea sp. 3N208 TaxID=3457421 RepID=UPI003FCFB664
MLAQASGVRLSRPYSASGKSQDDRTAAVTLRPASTGPAVRLAPADDHQDQDDDGDLEDEDDVRPPAAAAAPQPKTGMTVGLMVTLTAA